MLLSAFLSVLKLYALTILIIVILLFLIIISIIKMFNSKVPKNICSSEVMEKYLKEGGDPNASRYLGSGFYPIANCFNLMDDNPELLELYIAKDGKLMYEYGNVMLGERVTSSKSALLIFQYLQQYPDRFSSKQQQKIIIELLSKSRSISLLLIENGADIKIRDEGNNTVLHEAKSREVALLAIESRIDVNVTDVLNNTPLHEQKSLEVVQTLIEQGANVNFKNTYGRTPLHLAKNAAIAQYLIDSGANLTAKDNAVNTPLHSVSRPEVIAVLLKNGVDPNIKNENGQTKLHLLAIHINYMLGQYQDSIKTLVDAGGDLNIQDATGKTPIHLAVINIPASWFENYWLHPGIDLSIKDDRGYTALDYAKMYRDEKEREFKEQNTPSSETSLRHYTEKIDLLTNYNSQVD